MSGDREQLTLRKSWCRALGGGITAHLDWLALSLIGGGYSDGPDAQTPARAPQEDARPQKTHATPVAAAKPEAST